MRHWATVKKYNGATPDDETLVHRFRWLYLQGRLIDACTRRLADRVHEPVTRDDMAVSDEYGARLRPPRPPLARG